MRAIIAFALVPCALIAQTPPAGDLLRLTRDFRSAIEHDELTSAAELSEKLDAAVRAARNAWLTRDSQTRVDEVLSWLPAGIEALWVNQAPFSIKADDPLSVIRQTPVVSYCVDRLAAIADGKFYRALSNHTIRMTLAATRGLTSRSGSMIPDSMRRQDVVYFFFIADPFDLGPADESIENQPVWRGAANIVDQSVPFRQGVEQPKRDDPHWIALARTDLLILSNNRELLAEILGRIAHGSVTRALPASLSEWAQVDRGASFWGIRHYTQESRPKAGDYGFKNADLPNPDGAAIGASVKFDAGSEQLEIRYLSPSPLADGRPGDNVHSQFKVDQSQTGVSRLTSSLRQRGAFPLHLAFVMLGFGMYQ
jgi:hypothetical protein